MDPGVRAWQEMVPWASTWLSVVSVLEIRVGQLRVAGKDPVFAAKIGNWLEKTVLIRFVSRLIDVNLAIADTAAGMRFTHGMSSNDSLIAATAKVRGLTLATRNISDFEMAGIDLVNPWDFGK